MKKISALLLIFIMILQLGAFSTSAEETETFKIKPSDYTAGTPSEVNKTEGRAMVRPKKPLGYKITLPYTVGALQLTYNTSTGENGILRVRLGGTEGEIIGTLETYKVATSWSVTYTDIIGFSRPIDGTQEIWITVEVPQGGGGAHWLNDFTFFKYDASATSGEFSSGDAFEDIADDPHRHEINMLTDLGVYDNDEKKFVPYQPVTRLQFVSLLGNLIGAKNYATAESPFKDIKAGSENADLLSGLYQMGIIKGDTEGNFRPASFITPIEIATVCINALGYQSFAKNANAVLDLANTLDLFDGLRLTNKVTKSDAAKILYNLLLADYLAVAEMNDDDIFYNPTKNFLENLTNYKHATGVMTANSVTGLYAPKKGEGFMIDNERYIVKSGIPVNFLGVKCEFFYHEEDGERILDAIRPVPKAEWSQITSGVDIRFDTISERELKYTTLSDDEEYEYELDAKTAIIYNGLAMTKRLSSKISNPEDFEGSITIIDNNGDGVLEAIWIDHVTKIIKVGAVSNGRIKDVLTNTLYDTTDKNFALFINNKASMLEELTSDAILTVLESAETGRNKYVRAMAENNAIEGQISKISNGKYTIGDTEYKVSDACTDDLYVGLSGTFVLDKYDYIVSCTEGESSEAKIGVYVANDSGEATALNSVAKIKILTENGVEKFTVAKKIIADGVTVKNVDDFYNGVGAFTGLNNVALRSPILYRINAADEVSMIDTINDGTMDSNDQLVNLLDTLDSNPINGVMSNAFRVYNSTLSDAYYQPLYGVKTGVKVLALSSSGKESDYAILEGLSGSDHDTDMAPYSTKRDTITADIVLIRDYAKLSNTPATAFVVDYVTDAVDKEGNVVKKICGYTPSAKVEYCVDGDVYSSNSTFRNLINSLENGDLVRPFLTNGNISDIDLAYIPDCAPGEKFGPETNAAGINALIHSQARETAGRNTSAALFLAEVVEIEDNFVKLNLQKKDADGNWTNNYYVYNAINAKVTFCEKTASGTYKFSYGMKAGAMVSEDVIVCIKGSAGSCNGIFVFRDSNQ